MKKLSSSIVTILIFVASHSQDGYSFQIINDENVRKLFRPITSDNNGNTIITGQFETNITLGGTTLTGGTYGAYNAAFVAKVLPGGSIAWAKAFSPLTIPNGLSSITVKGINTDAAGNIYVTGDVVGKIGFGVPNVSLASTKNGSVYTRDIFALKMSAAGTVLWAKSDGTANDGCNAPESGNSITTDDAGNIYVTGSRVWKVFKNTTICNDVCPGATSKSITCPIIIKYSSAGQKIWEKLFPNNGVLSSTSCYANHPSGTDIRTDGMYIYILGYSYGTVNFGTGPLSTGSETKSNSFLLKMTGDGTTQWARLVTGNANKPYEVGDDLLVDGNDIYISGIGDNISFGSCSLPAGSPPAFFAKYSSSGNCEWAVNQGGASHGVVKHPNGNLAMLRKGSFFSIQEFSALDGSLVGSTVTPLEDAATASIWGYPSLAKLPDGFIFSHHIQGTLHFGDLTITSLGSYDNMMLIRFTAPEPLPIARQGTIIAETSSNKMVLYPNPASNQITIQNNNNKMLGTVSIFDVSGKMIYKKFAGSSQATFDVKNFSSGVYYVRSDQLQATIKFVKE